MRSNTTFFIWLLLPFLSCSHGKLNPRAYLIWYGTSDNALAVTREMNEITFKSTLLNPDYFLAEMALKNSQEDIDSGSVYIKFEIKVKSSEDPLSYGNGGGTLQNERLNYLISEIQKDFSLTDDGYTIQPAMHHFERTFHAGNSIVVMLVFNTPFKALKSPKLIYDDQLFSKGRIVFDFPIMKSIDLPELSV